MTKIICTIGPTSHTIPIIEELAEAGMTVARINFSHGSRSQQEEYISNIRKVNSTSGFNIKILQDLEGFRIRLGKFPENILLFKGMIVELVQSKESFVKTKSVVPLDFEGNFKALCKGTDIYVDDGNIHLKVIFCKKDKLTVKVIVPGVLSSNKGINIPGVELKYTSLTTKDKEDLEIGIEHKVDYIAQSFVRNAADIINLRSYLQKRKSKSKIIAKIENREGINNIDAIIKESDGIMIARGDMGVSIPVYEVPVVQKQILKKCKSKKMISITATQMLESMRLHPTPTRAEVSDVANAVLDGSQYVMLSAETAVGKYPVETVKLMKHVIDHTLKYAAGN